MSEILTAEPPPREKLTKKAITADHTPLRVLAVATSPQKFEF
jgi:hypothetical protein